MNMDGYRIRYWRVAGFTRNTGHVIVFDHGTWEDASAAYADAKAGKYGPGEYEIVGVINNTLAK